MNKNILYLLLPILINGFKDSSSDDSSDFDLDDEWYNLWWVWMLFGFGVIFFLGLLIWSIRYYLINRIIPEDVSEQNEEVNEDNNV